MSKMTFSRVKGIFDIKNNRITFDCCAAVINVALFSVKHFTNCIWFLLLFLNDFFLNWYKYNYNQMLWKYNFKRIVDVTFFSIYLHTKIECLNFRHLATWLLLVINFTSHFFSLCNMQILDFEKGPLFSQRLEWHMLKV